MYEISYKDKIISDIADTACKKIIHKVIRKLQKMTEGMQSGDDSGLKNMWDEICVQVQSQLSIMWELYIDIIRQLIICEVENLDKATKQAIWLQTQEGIDWECTLEEDEELGEIIYCEENITEYVLSEYIISAAADWTNTRIERYLSTCCEMDK